MSYPYTFDSYMSAGIIAAHRAQMGLLLNARLLCGCGETFDSEGEWGHHVADQLGLIEYA